MIADLFAWLFALLVVDPITADLNEKLAAVGAPAAVYEQVGRCAAEAGPALAQRAANDPWSGAVLAFEVAVGWTPASGVLANASPACGQAVAAAEAALAGELI